MKPRFLLSLLVVACVLFPLDALAANAKPKATGNDQPTSAAEPQQRPADPSAAELKANSDAEKLESNKPKVPKSTARPTSMDVTAVPGGRKTLTIHFRWSLYPNASIETRLVPGFDPQGVTVTPIYFWEHLKGKVRDALYACLDHEGEGGKSHRFTKDKIVYDMIGRRNTLGNQGVHVRVHPEPEKDEKQEANPAAAFLQLDTWAVDPETLSLDLDRDEFAKSGTLFVWFFRGDQLVWEEHIRWPGYK